MIIREFGAEFLYDGITYHIGDEVIGTNESEYEGLWGRITEIRTDDDKDTDNETPDIYCSFEPPVLPTDIKRVEKVFTDSYGMEKTVDQSSHKKGNDGSAQQSTGNHMFQQKGRSRHREANGDAQDKPAPVFGFGIHKNLLLSV